MEITTLAELTVQVKPGTLNTQSSSPSQSTPLADTQKTMSQTGPADSSTQHETNDFYSVLSLILGLGWLLTSVAWYFSKYNKSAIRSITTSKPVEKSSTSLNAVKKACLANDAQLAKTRMLNWGHGRWPGNPPNSIGEIANRLGSASKSQINELNKILYSSKNENWNGKDLWLALSTDTQRKQQSEKEPEPILAPLFP